MPLSATENSERRTRAYRGHNPLRLLTLVAARARYLEGQYEDRRELLAQDAVQEKRKQQAGRYGWLDDQESTIPQ